jgi:hypothetical protein
MGWTKTALRHLRAFGRIQGFECEIEAELLFHIEMRTQQNIEAGMQPDTAKQDALKRFGDFDQLKDRCRKVKQEALVSQLAKAVKLFTWAIAIGGFALPYLIPVKELQQAGNLLVAIAILLRLFLYVRKLSHKRHSPFSEPEASVLFEDEYRRTAP